MYMLNFVDYYKDFGLSDWLNCVVYSLGLSIIFFLIGIFLFFIGEKIYEVISLINKVEDLEKEVKDLKEGSKK